MVKRTLTVIGILFIAIFSASGQEEWVFSHDSGSYATDVHLSVLQPEPENVDFRFLGLDAESTENRFIPVAGSLVLGAPDGSELTYEIEFRDHTSRSRIVTIAIDKRKPDPPLPDQPPGVYARELSLSFSGEDNASVQVSVPSADGGSFAPFTGSLRVPGESGQVVDYEILGYAIDSAGNQSDLRRWHYRIDRTNETPHQRNWLASPSEGLYANEQSLYVDSRGLHSIEYTLDAGTTWFPYEGLTFITGRGRKTVTVRAVTTTDSVPVTITRSWTQQQNRDTPIVSPVSESYPDGLTVSAQNGRVRYTIGDKPTASDSPILLQPLRIAPRPGTKQIVVLRAQPVPAGEIPESRYVYVIDARRPPPPDVVEWEDGFSLFSLYSADVYLRSSDQTSRESGVLVTEPVFPDPGSTWVARARYPEGNWSPETILTVPPLSPPSPPELADEPVVTGTLFQARFTQNDCLIEASLNGTDYSKPFRPATDGTVRFRLPYGFQSVVQFRNTDENFSVSVPVNLAPPDAPVVSITNGLVTIAGDGTVFYRVVQSSADPLDFRQYTGPFSLTGPTTTRTDFRIDAFVETPAGPRSIVQSTLVSVDSREPTLPVFEGIVDQGLYAADEIVVAFSNPYPDLRVYYEITSDGTRPKIPNSASPATYETIRFLSDEGETTSYQVALRCRFDSGTRWSPVTRVSFTVDRIAPEPPVIVSPGNQVVSATPLNLVFSQPTEPGVQISYRLDPSHRFQQYSRPVLLSTETGTLQEYSVEAFTEDPAGNRTVLDTAYTITIDREPPAVPRLFHSGQELLEDLVEFNTETVVDIRTDDPRYSLFFSLGTADQSITPDVRLWTGEPIVLRGSQGTVQNYALSVYAQDRLGNISPVRTVEIHIDLDSPPLPQVPEISRSPGGREGYLYWSVNPGERLFYSLNREGFTRYISPVPWNLQNRSLEVLFFVIDSAGNRSDTGSMRISAPQTATPPSVTGVENGHVYAESVRIAPQGNDSVRYSVATGGVAAPPVHALSPLFGSSLLFDAAPGERIDIELRFRTFPETGNPSPETTVRFTIDREPPSPPEIEGVEPGAYYPETKSARILAQPGDTVYFRAFRESLMSPPPFQEYSGSPILLEGRLHETLAYIIEAYTEDTAGNRSQFVSRWPVTIDQEIVFVDPESAPGGNGTRELPYRSLDTGLQNASQQQRSTIFLAPGSYLIGPNLLSELSGDESFHIIGWNGVPVISTRSGTLELPAGTVLQNVRLTSSAAVIPSGSTDPVRLDGVVFASEAGTPQLTVTGGSVHLIRVHGQSDGSIELDGSVLDASLSELGALRAVNQSRITLDSSTVSGITARRSTIQMQNTVIEGNIDTRDSTALVKSSIIRSDDTRILWVAFNDRLEVIDSTLYAQGSDAAIAIRQTGGSIIVQDSIIATGGSAELGYAIALRNTEALLQRSVCYSQGTDESIPVVASGGTVTIENSTLTSGGGRFTRYGGSFTGTRISINRSVIVSVPDDSYQPPASRPRTEPQTALFLGTNTETLSLTDNIFTPWEAILYRPLSTSWNRRSFSYTAADVNARSQTDTIHGNEADLLPGGYGVPAGREIFAYAEENRSSAGFRDRSDWLAPSQLMAEREVGPVRSQRQ